MAITERTEIDKIEIVDTWHIQVRQANIVERDGAQIARTFHRWTLNPDSDISTQEQRVQDIANAAWTPEVVAAYEAFKAEQTI
jgi:hypothetical protein